jgi:orotidine-5'-phosphate decarboxylase
MGFLEKIVNAERTNNSLLCVGLDTDIKKLPDCIKKSADPIYEFNSRIIEKTKDIVSAYKINVAFYEALGKSGWETLEKTLALIPKNILSIADAKRGDIGNTSELYARAFFEKLTFDSITVNPYLGFDSIQPFLNFKDKGVIILALTSNKGSKDFQYLNIDGNTLYEKVVDKVLEWNVNSNCAIVVGATHPDELKKLRKKAPALPFLIPGIGAQGGDLEATIKYGCDKNGELALINVSRGILYASSESNFDEKAREAAIKFNEEINHYRLLLRQ